jgi:hypothetical protein
MLGQLVNAVLERALEAELTAHRGYGDTMSSGTTPATPATGGGRARPSKPGSGPCTSRCRGIGRACSIGKGLIAKFSLAIKPLPMEHACVSANEFSYHG